MLVFGVSVAVYAQMEAADREVAGKDAPPPPVWPAARLPKDIPVKPYPRVKPDIVIAFETDSLQTLPSEIRKLNQFGEILRMFPDFRIYITGHSALLGSPEGRMVSALGRAQVVADYLIDNGYVMPGRIDIGSFGAQYPAANNDTWINRRKNRRVEIFFLN
ncbi:hypothetical protein AGMMS50267_10730 [Spirochaetia bacterium]|nr:hypothetical protein AGMMS50267_10730 [Spirochaetia bacterium]